MEKATKQPARKPVRTVAETPVRRQGNETFTPSREVKENLKPVRSGSSENNNSEFSITDLSESDFITSTTAPVETKPTRKSGSNILGLAVIGITLFLILK